MQSPAGPAVSHAVRTASRGEHDASVRIVGTGIALGLVVIAMHALAPSTPKLRSRSSARRP